MKMSAKLRTLILTFSQREKEFRRSRDSNPLSRWERGSRSASDGKQWGRLIQSAIVVIGLCGLSLSSAFAQSDAQFAKANQEYAAGHFKEAIDGYEALTHAGPYSANLFYNLGNAYFRTGNFGRAILNYERALALDRHHPESEANLRV